MATIESLRNPRIVAVRKLDERKHRREERRFLVEGTQIIAMGLAAGARPVEAFHVPGATDDVTAGPVMDALRSAGAELVAVSPQVMEALAERRPPQGLVATFAIEERALAAVTPPPDALVVIVEELADPGNLGTILRSADAAGAAAVIVITPCVDPYDPRAVRGSMGSIFHVPVVETDDLAGACTLLRTRGLRIVATAPGAGAPWGRGVLDRGTALLLGNETRGLSPTARSLADAWAHLPIAGRAESLNVAVAGSILMYEWLKNRTAGRQ